VKQTGYQVNFAQCLTGTADPPQLGLDKNISYLCEFPVPGLGKVPRLAGGKNQSVRVIQLFQLYLQVTSPMGQNNVIICYCCCLVLYYQFTRRFFFNFLRVLFLFVMCIQCFCSKHFVPKCQKTACRVLIRRETNDK